jgi:hypothetical protein
MQESIKGAQVEWTINLGTKILLLYVFILFIFSAYKLELLVECILDQPRFYTHHVLCDYIADLSAIILDFNPLNAMLLPTVYMRCSIQPL